MAALASKHPAFSLAVDGRVPGPLPKASFNQQQGSGEGAGILAGFAKKKKKKKHNPKNPHRCPPEGS